MLEDRILKIINPTMRDCGFEIVLIRIHGSKTAVIEVFIDRLDEKNITVEDCRTASRNISALLDVEGVIDVKYNLHVSSPGIERPLIKLSDYQRFINREVRIRLKHPVSERTQFKGQIVMVEGDNITLKAGGENFPIAFGDIKNANLVLTDELFKELLKKDFKE